MEENSNQNQNSESQKAINKAVETKISKIRLTKEIALGIVQLPGYQPLLSQAGVNWQQQLAKDSAKLLDEIIKQYGEDDTLKLN